MCSVSAKSYTPDSNAFEGRWSRPPGPIIIGQDNPDLSKVFNRMNLKQQEAAGLVPQTDFFANRSPSLATSYTDRKGSLGVHTPSPLVGLGHGGHGTLSPYSPSWIPSARIYGTPSPVWSPYSPGTIGQERDSPTPLSDMCLQSRGDIRMHSRQSFDVIHSGHNVVDIARIRAGLDVRTTVRSPECSRSNAGLMRK